MGPQRSVRAQPAGRLVAGLVIVSLAASGCTPLRAAPEPDPPRYQTNDLNLCEWIDLGPLDRWSPTVWEEAPAGTVELHDGDADLVPAPGTCLFGMRTAAGQHSHLEIRSYVEGSLEDAQVTYERQRERAVEPATESPMDPDGEGQLDPDGVGEEAAGFTRERSDPLLSWTTHPEAYQRYPEYRLVVRDSNLVLEVHLGIGDRELATEELAGPVRAIAAEALAALAPGAAAAPIPPRGRAYQTVELDICELLDLTPVVDRLPLSSPELHVVEHEHLPALAECRVSWLSDHPDLRQASLTVVAHGRYSIVSAEDTYDSRLDRASHSSRRPWRADPEVAPVGERTSAVTVTDRVDGTDLIDSEYQLLTLEGNLVIHLALAVSGYVEVPREVLHDGPHQVAHDLVTRVPLVDDL